MPAPRLRSAAIHVLSAVFFFSGFSSLTYQVVWQRLLTVHYGVGTISIALIVSVYMLGLGAGAFCGGILAERARRLLMLYFVIELLIGFFGVLSLPFLDVLGRRTAGGSYAASFLWMSVFLATPTLLMGMTLPILVKIMNRMVNDFLRAVGFLYFINTLGAAAGAALASYVLISFFGLDRAIYVAAAINLVLAVAILTVARTAPAPAAGAPGAAPEPVDIRGGGLGKRAYYLVFITGFLAIGYEIIWFRLISVLIKASPYAFSTTLCVYLLGIALGSYGMERWLSRRRDIDRTSLFFTLQFFTGAAVLVSILAYYHLTRSTGLVELTRAVFAKELHPQSLAAGELLEVFAWPVFFSSSCRQS